MNGCLQHGCVEKGLYGKGQGCTPESFCANVSLSLYFGDVRKLFFEPFIASREFIYQESLPTEPLVQMKGHLVGAEFLAECLRSHCVAHEPHGVPDVIFGDRIASKADLTACTMSGVVWVGQRQVFVLVQSRTLFKSCRSSSSLKYLSPTK